MEKYLFTVLDNPLIGSLKKNGSAANVPTKTYSGYIDGEMQYISVPENATENQFTGNGADKYKLINIDLVDSGANKLAEPKIEEYCLLFCYALSALKPLHEIVDFLDYQYQYTKNAKAFLNTLKHVILKGYDTYYPPGLSDLNQVSTTNIISENRAEFVNFWLANKGEQEKAIQGLTTGDINSSKPIIWYFQQYRTELELQKKDIDHHVNDISDLKFKIEYLDEVLKTKRFAIKDFESNSANYFKLNQIIIHCEELKEALNPQKSLHESVEVDKNELFNEPFELAERLLIIRYLQETGMFWTYDPSKGQTKKQFERIVSQLLCVKENTVKARFQMVDKVLQNKDLTKENKTERLKQLNTIKAVFDSINQREISGKIQNLMERINSKL